MLEHSRKILEVGESINNEFKISKTELNKNAFEDSINWILDGMKSLVPAIVILVLAWSLNGVLSDLKLGEFLSDFIVSTEMDFYLLPVIVFIFFWFYCIFNWFEF